MINKKTKIKRISILQEFKCIGADCSVNCCKGWKVPIDEQAYIKFMEERGFFGTLLRCSIERKKDIIAFRSILGRCPFWGADRLCAIQKKHGTKYMPLVCIQFPRQLYNLDFFCEETLYLACPEAARLFLTYAMQDKPFDFEAIEGEISYEVNTTNDDEDFLNYLLQSRDELISMLQTGCRFDNMAFLNYGRDAQNACLAHTPLPSPLAYLASPELKEYYEINCSIMNKLFFNGFYHPSLRTISPLLYKLCNQYINRFATLFKISPSSADKKLAALKEELYEKVPNLDKLLNRYYEYFLQSNFLDTFEDYSFSKRLLLGVAKANMLWLFIALYAQNKKRISIDELAKIIAVYERRAPQIEDALVLLQTNISFPSSTSINSEIGPKITPPSP